MTIEKYAEGKYPPKIEARGGWGTEFDYNESERKAFIEGLNLTAEFAEWVSEHFRRSYPTQRVYPHTENEKLWFPINPILDGNLKKLIHTTPELIELFLDEK